MAKRRLALIVLAVALGVRLLYLQGLLPVLETRQTPVYGDAAGYAVTAGVLLHGGPIVAHAGEPRTGQQERAARLARHMLSTRGPGYASFLTAVFALFGEDPWPVRYLQAAIGALACALVFLLGSEVADRRVGLVAGLIAAFHPSFVLFTGRILTETLAIFLFSLGLWALVRSLRLRALPWLCASGLAIALAALTRPTLLATVPFVVAAAVVGLRGVPFGRRAGLIAAFSLVLVVPLLAWNRVAAGIAEDPVAGESGFRIVAEVFQTASAPRFRGWRTDDSGYGATPFGETDEEWAVHLRSVPLYPVPAVLNLVFYHLWFLDDLWREVPAAWRAPHRGVVILALGGVGMALARWRAFAPLVFVLVPMAIVSVKWIEIRPNLVFLPVVFVLAGVCVAGSIDLVARGARPARRLALLVAAGAATILVIGASRLFTLVALFPSLDPLALGALGDGTIVAVAVGWGALLAGLASGQYPRREAVMIGLVPPLLFVPLFASYCFIVSEPRWRSWEVTLDGAQGPLTQRIRLRQPLALEEVARARWLVDLRTDADPPPLRAAVNGVWLTPEQASWRRLFCRTGDEIQGGAAGRRLHDLSCGIYEQGISSFTGALAASPQWWGLDVEPAVLGSEPRVSLTLERRPAEDLGAVGVALGGGFSTGEAGVFHGPSAVGVRPGAGSSLLRWHLARDWRMWREQRLESAANESSLGGAGEAPRIDRPARRRALAELIARRRARFHILLAVEFEDGRRALY